jgi:hypothetical protein
MGRIMRIPALAVFLACAAGVAQAQEWSSFDARSRSLGGAGVAFADSRVDSMYWNPASLASLSEKPFDFTTGWGFSMTFFEDAHIAGGALSTATHIIDEYKNFDYQSIQNQSNLATQTDVMVQEVVRIVDDLTKLDRSGQGAKDALGMGFQVRVGPFGLFVRAKADLGAYLFSDFSKAAALSTTATPFFATISPPGALQPNAASLAGRMQAAGLTLVDAQKLAFQAQTALGDAALADPKFTAAMVDIARATAANYVTPGSLQGTLYYNGSGAAFRSIIQGEAGIALGLPLLPTLLDAGIALKDVHTEASYTQITFADRDAGGISKRLKDDLRSNRRSADTVNMDLGLQATPLGWLSAGLSARNVIPMDIHLGGPESKVHEDPELRFGARARALGFISVGMDIDLVETKSLVLPGYKNQQFGAGVEFDLPKLLGYPLMIIPRVGFQDNLAESREKGLVTAGLGLQLYAFTLDLGAEVALDKAEAKAATLSGKSAKSYPERLSAALTLGVNVPF